MSKSQQLEVQRSGSIEAFMSAAYRVPALSLDEERDLGNRLRDYDDAEAARRLVMSHMRFVIRIARGYLGYGLPLADLVQEGNVGLVKAVKRFDPNLGVRLASFAVHWIRAEIHEYILRNWRVVKVATTKAQRKLFFNLRSSRKRLGWLSQDEAEDIARDLGVKADEVRRMEARMSLPELSFDGDEGDGDDPPSAPAAWIADLRAEPAQALERYDAADSRRKQLYEALQRLDERSRHILRERWLGETKPTLHELAKRFGVSAERIRQIEKAAMRKLRLHLAL
jgi:RNA polymerase sigma-32 factor